MNKLVIVGNGKLAEAIEKNFLKYSNIPVIKYTTDIEADRNTVFIHIGSGRQYKESLEYAITKGASYIQAATEKDIRMDAPKEINIKYISAENLDIKIIKLFYWLKLGRELFKNEHISIVESHQKDKESLPGTALKICEYLNIPKESLVSVRDHETQKILKINNLDHHAYHKIVIGDDDSSISIETKIDGAISYVKGLVQIMDSIPKLNCGYYEVDDLIKLNKI